MFNIWFNKKKEKPKQILIKDDTMASVVFRLMSDGTIKSELHWLDFVPEFSNSQIEIIAAQYAALLYLLSKGSFEEDIMELLNNAKKINTSDQDQYFLMQVASHMFLLDTINKKPLNFNKPLITPTNVFKR